MYSFQPLLILSDIFHDTVSGELSEITSSICVTVHRTRINNQQYYY
jgi:hypothetical protein